MPFISVSTAGALTQKQKDTVKSGLGQSISLITGKKEKALMVDVSDGHTLYFGGQPMETGAYVDVRLFGEATFEDKKALTEAIFQLLGSACGIAEDKIYVTFSSYAEWGTRGTLY